MSAGEQASGPKVVALAAPAGGLEALGRILAALPSGFPAAVLVVQHLAPGGPNLLPFILSRRTALRVAEARDGQALQPGTVFVAPPDRHLVVGPGDRLALTDGPKVSHARPSATVLFESLAAHVGDRAVAVVLTGGDGDGAAALPAVRRAGGAVIAQERATSQAPAMPEAAVRTGQVDEELPLEAIPAALERLAATT